jgi:hypothetical protein
MPRTLAQYADLLEALEKSFVESFSFQSDPPLTEVFKEPRLLIAISHSTPLSWIPAVSVLAIEAVKSGAGHRIPRAVMDHWFYSNPFTRKIAEFLTQSDRPQSFDELLTSFAMSENSDLVIFPEGANTFFGSVHEVEDFRSYRFMELAIRAEAPILVTSHKGSEGWSVPLQLPPEWGVFLLPFSKFFGEKLLQSKTFNFPLLPKKLPQFKMACHLYHPTLKVQDLSNDPGDRKRQLKEEAEKVKACMNSLLLTLS